MSVTTVVRVPVVDRLKAVIRMLSLFSSPVLPSSELSVQNIAIGTSLTYAPIGTSSSAPTRRRGFTASDLVTSTMSGLRMSARTQSPSSRPLASPTSLAVVPRALMTRLSSTMVEDLSKSTRTASKTLASSIAPAATARRECIPNDVWSSTETTLLSQYKRSVTISNVIAKNGKLLAGVNSNYGDVATISTSSNSYSSVKSICDTFKGNSNGDEPSKLTSNKANSS